MIDSTKLGVRIVSRRRELHMTQSELAAALHISAQAVSKWERGTAFPNPAFLDELAAFLHLTLDELLTGGAMQSSSH